MTGQTQKGQLPNESVFGLFKRSARQARLFWCNRTFKRLHNGSSNTIRWFSWNQMTAMDSSAKNKPVIFQCRIVQTKREQRDVCIGNDASRVTKVGLVSCRNPPEEAGDRVGGVD